MTYNGGISAHAAKVNTRYHRVFVGVCTEVERSVKDGSELTGASGQPRDTSNLYFSWIGKFLSRFSWRLATNVEYAPIVEENVRGVQFRNHGPHSVAMTILGADRILQTVTERQRNA